MIIIINIKKMIVGQFAYKRISKIKLRKEFLQQTAKKHLPILRHEKLKQATTMEYLRTECDLNTLMDRGVKFGQ